MVVLAPLLLLLLLLLLLERPQGSVPGQQPVMRCVWLLGWKDLRELLLLLLTLQRRLAGVWTLLFGHWLLGRHQHLLQADRSPLPALMLLQLLLLLWPQPPVLQGQVDGCWGVGAALGLPPPPHL